LIDIPQKSKFKKILIYLTVFNFHR